MALLALLPLLTAGCLSPLAKHSAALDAATAPVVDQAAAVYSSANAIHDLRVNYDAVVAFDAPAPAPVYNPRTIQPLMSDKDIRVRIAVLAAFQEYVKSVVAITNGTDSPELQAAASSVGQELSSLGNTLAPSIESTLGIASAAATSSSADATASTTSTPAPAISLAAQNGISTAVDALAQFLISRKVKKELPHIIVAMDPHVKALCGLLESDIATLTDQENRDYNFIINQQTQFLLATKNLDAAQRRDLIMKLPEIVRKEQASSQALKQLSASIARLELTHHALAAAAQGNNPESLKQKLGELEAAGSELKKFYSSLPTQ